MIKKYRHCGEFERMGWVTLSIHVLVKIYSPYWVGPFTDVTHAD